MVKLMARESPSGSVPTGGAPPSALDAQRATRAHEFRNALAIIMTNLEFALAGLETGSEQHAALRDAREATGRLSKLVAETFDVRGIRPEEAPLSSVERRGFDRAEPGSGALPRVARILVVDDEPPIGAALRRSLRDYEVIVTASGGEALALIASGERFDVILCDVTMPGMGGDDAYREMQRVAPDQAERMVFVTGGVTTEGRREFMASVPNPVLEKPFEVGMLRETIRARIATRER